MPEHSGALPGPDVPVTVTGDGWAAVAELPVGTVSTDVSASPLFDQVTVAVESGRVFSTTLLNVLVTDDGRVFAGSVPVEALQAAAAE